jgi:hypothetical protein
VIDGRVADRLLAAAVRVAPDRPDRGCWGVLIDDGSRLVITVGGAAKDRDELPISVPGPGSDGRATAHESVARVVARGVERDLVLLQADRLPARAHALPLSDGPLPMVRPLVSFTADPGTTPAFSRRAVGHVLQPPHL